MKEDTYENEDLEEDNDSSILDDDEDWWLNYHNFFLIFCIIVEGISFWRLCFIRDRLILKTSCSLFYYGFFIS